MQKNYIFVAKDGGEVSLRGGAGSSALSNMQKEKMEGKMHYSSLVVRCETKFETKEEIEKFIAS